MIRKITSAFFGSIALYALYIGIQFFQLQIERNYNLVNVTTYFSFFIVFLVLIIVLYELLRIDKPIKMVFIFITIINLDYFIIAFFLNLISIAEGSWAGEVHQINMLFYMREFSLATLIEYNQYFYLPMIFNILAAVVLITMIIIRRKR